jgi:ribosome assembly protein SQT1
MFNDKYRNVPAAKSKDPWICGLTGKRVTMEQARVSYDYLARAFKKELGYEVNSGTEWDKVIALFSLNTIDYMLVPYAIHRLNGVCSPVSAAYNSAELEYQLKSAGAKACVTCLPLLQTTLTATRKLGIPDDKVYLLDLPEVVAGKNTTSHKTIWQLIEEGSKLPELDAQNWGPDQGKTQCAFLSYSSGTSGLPKGVKIAHHNIITNIVQAQVFESKSREQADGSQSIEVSLGLLPFSHIYGLVVINFASAWRGDSIVVLPKFELNSLLNAVQKHKITLLYVVPPIVIALLNMKDTVKKFDMSSVHTIYTGAAPLGRETAEAMMAEFGWLIRQGYGLTETCTVVASSSAHDIELGTSGSLFPGFTAKLLDTTTGAEIHDLNTPGELVVQSPSVVLGYLNNPKADEETFLPDTDGKGRWMKTGDEAIFTRAKSGNLHVTIVDRVKELIKVKGNQVAPAELEAHILAHEDVADVAVIPVPDDRAGEVPKAFVVKSKHVTLEDNDRLVARRIAKWVEEHKTRYKWLAGGVEFIDEIPKSPSGKILRRLLRDKEKEKRKKQGAKL